MALAIALFSWWHERQLHVPKARARIFLGCGAIRKQILFCQWSPSLSSLFLFSVPCGLMELSPVPEEKQLIRGILELYFVGLENLSGDWKGIVADVCVSAVLLCKVVLKFLCPSIERTVSIGVPLESVTVVANVWRAA